MDVAVVVARWFFFTAAMVAFGASLFPLYAGADGIAERHPAALRVFPLALGGIAMAAALGWIAALAADFSAGEGTDLIATIRLILFETSFGAAWLFRFAALLLFLLVAAIRPKPLALVAVATLLLAGEAWIGHAAAGGGVQRLVQIVHLLAAGAWLGGLLPLALVLRDGARRASAEEGARRAVLRFSAMGVVSVALIVLSGEASTWFVAGKLPGLSLPADDYDLVLGLKLAVFLAMVGLALFNRFRLTPGLFDASPDRRRNVLHLFRRTVLVEQGLGFAVLLLAAVLGTTSPMPA
ncbi:MAG TPA: copper homeostasis membrane protein CopD [Bauldia sp.]|nr:copper homeostasis membrane protein CopD [Bauldia sp.]